MLTAETIPASWAATLAHVRTVFPQALMAGGCLRDLDNGRQVKDIDIFAPNCPTDFAATSRLVIPGLVPEGMLVGSMGGYEDWATPEVVGVFNLSTPDLDYQLICLSSDQASILDRIDFGLCRIAFDGAMIHRTDHYHADRNNQRFTLRRCENSQQYDRSLKRMERFAEKYPGWPMAVSDELRAQGFCSPSDVTDLFYPDL